MTNCNFCGNGKGCICGFGPANDNEADVIRLPSDARLASPASVQRLAIAYAAFGISRRRLIDFIADAIFSEERIVVDAQERNLLIDDELIDRVFTESDPSVRWLSDWLAFRHCAPSKDAQARTLPRYRLLWLALYIRYPDTAMSVVR